MPGRVGGKVALVTGGASGIGRATALAFAREGAKLIIADMQEDGGHQTVYMIQENGGEATFVRTDVTQATAVAALISKAVEIYGRLDCAHNNAGISGLGIAGTQRALTADYPEERWHRVIAIHLTGIWLCMKYELAQMLQQGGGAIVNTALDAGLVGLPYASAYGASKHGVVGLTKTAALEYAQQGIRVNCVCPGSIATPMTAQGMQDPERMARMIASEPMGRVGTPEEVAEAVVWLCSDAASFVTGHTITVDGGMWHSGYEEDRDAHVARSSSPHPFIAGISLMGALLLPLLMSLLLFLLLGTAPSPIVEIFLSHLTLVRGELVGVWLSALVHRHYSLSNSRGHRLFPSSSSPFAPIRKASIAVL